MRKMNELYVTKKITLTIPFRNKKIRIDYIIVAILKNEMVMMAKLKSMKYPCKIPCMENIEIELPNEFPNKRLLSKINKIISHNKKTKKDEQLRTRD